VVRTRAALAARTDKPNKPRRFLMATPLGTVIK
jgi:hypothetical protein